jgi:hypothetical protein
MVLEHINICLSLIFGRPRLDLSRSLLLLLLLLLSLSNDDDVLIRLLAE